MSSDPFFEMTDDERLQLAVAACRRESIDRQEIAFSFLKEAYPAAPEPMVRSLAFHAYFDLPTKVMHLAGRAELSFQQKRHGVTSGVIYPLLYDLYNAIQIEALVPEGKQRIFDLLKDIEDNLEANALDLIRRNVEELKNVLNGTEGAPHVE